MRCSPDNQEFADVAAVAVDTAPESAVLDTAAVASAVVVFAADTAAAHAVRVEQLGRVLPHPAGTPLAWSFARQQ